MSERSGRKRGDELRTGVGSAWKWVRIMHAHDESEEKLQIHCQPLEGAFK